jgi:hypothetical protein
MSSTSNKNTQGNYYLEHKSNQLQSEYMTFINSSAGKSFTGHLAGDGLLPAKNARSQLCNNYCDIESQLFGIGTTNLVNAYKPVTPNLHNIPSLSIYKKQNVQIPEPLVIEHNQRPQYLN